MDQTEFAFVVPKWPTQPWYKSNNVIPGTICGDPTKRKYTSTKVQINCTPNLPT